MSALRKTTVPFYILFFFSGAAALGCQLIWSKLFALGLGQDFSAILAVICAFMAGMALGSWFLDKPFSRFPNRSYALIELVIALWVAASSLLIGPANQLALRLIGLDSPLRQWTVSFIVPLLLLLPATMAMGASFPAMERCIAAVKASGRTIPGIYAANTFGAVAGTLSSIFLIAPALGLSRTLLLLAGINLLCAVAAFILTTPALERKETPPPKGQHISPARLVTTLAITGLAGIGFETAGVRVLSQILENTVYSFAAVLATFLLGTSAGAALYHRFARGPSRYQLSWLLSGLALSSLVSVVLLQQAPAVYEALRIQPHLLSEMFVGILAFGLPTIFMGATFSHLVQSWRDVGFRVGKAVAWNTAGSALAPLLFSVLLLPLLGSKWTLVLIAATYLCLLPLIHAAHWAVIGLSCIVLLFLPRNLRIIDVPPGGSIVNYREGITASVAVVEDGTRNRTLRVNNHFQMGGTGAAEAEYRHAHIPLLLHPNPKQLLVLGLGTGITLGAASLHPNLRSDGVELLPEVLAAVSQFEPRNHSPQQNPAVNLRIADARRFVKQSQTQYDVIIADLFHPAMDGAGSLYTVEHFQAIRTRLAPGGLFCQWLPLHQLDESTLRVIVKTFLNVFPEAQAYLLRFNVDAPVLGLVGMIKPPTYSDDWVEQRLANSSVELEIKRLALADSVRFFGNLLAGPRELAAFGANAELNYDDHPVVMFRAPELAYRKTASSYGRLIALLDKLNPDPKEALGLRGDVQNEEFARKLRAYFAARKSYIHGLVAEAEKRSNDAIDAFVESARLSGDFTPGYAQCLTLASLEARSNPAKARALLERLVAAQPSRPVAQQMLDRLSP